MVVSNDVQGKTMVMQLQFLSSCGFVIFSEGGFEGLQLLLRCVIIMLSASLMIIMLWNRQWRSHSLLVTD